MKNIFTILVTLFILTTTLYIEECQAQWVQTTAGIPSNQRVSSFGIIGNNIVALTHGSGIFLSSNNGTNWTTLNSGLTNLSVWSLAFSGTNIFAGTDNGVFLSTNNGASWSIRNTGMANMSVRSVAVAGTNIFAGTISYGVFYSTNNGSSWASRNTGLTNQSIQSLVSSGTNLFAGTWNGVFLSTNNGSNWSVLGVTGNIINNLTFLGTNLFAGTDQYNGVFKSTNNGTNWSQTTLSSKRVYSFTTFGNNIFTGTEGSGLYLSTNMGVSWTQYNQGLPYAPTVNSSLISNNYIFVGIDGNSVWRRPLSDLINGIQIISTEIPSVYSLAQNYPNPFNPTTNIKFNVAKFSDIRIVVYDLMGREVQTLVNESLKPGTYETSFDGSMLNSGVYFYKITAEDFSETRKMLLIK